MTLFTDSHSKIWMHIARMDPFLYMQIHFKVGKIFIGSTIGFHLRIATVFQGRGKGLNMIAQYDRENSVTVGDALLTMLTVPDL